MFTGRNIAVISGVTGNIDDAIQAFIAGKLVAGKNLCDH
jgi:hypothetical protein